MIEHMEIRQLIVLQKEDVISHPEYIPTMTYHDIALIRLSKPVNFTRYIRPACLYTSIEDNPDEAHLTATGWGVTNPDSKSCQLRKYFVM